MSDRIKFAVECEMDKEHVNTFLSALQKVQQIGESDSSELVSIFAGSFNPVFSWTVAATVDEDPPRSKIGYVFDAG
jgi:hypothetical protein